jgi:N6-adenosine-specific RNA methylase IME4
VKRYSILLADPPWHYQSRCQHSDTRFGGGVHAHYPTMPTSAICGLRWGDTPIGALAAPDAALFLWVTGPHLASGLEVARAWGFEVKTIGFTWVKTTKNDPDKAFFGGGYYTKANAELCLLGIRGRMEPLVNDVAQVILAPHPRDPETGKIIHSRKPPDAHERIVRLFGDLPRLELFARVAVPGWDVLGNQLGEGAVHLGHANEQMPLFGRGA